MPEIRKCELPGKGYPGEGVKEAGGKALALENGLPCSPCMRNENPATQSLPSGRYP